MSKKLKVRIVIDLLMTGCLLFLMPYELVGRMAHEWIGAGMLVLFILHHILNRQWIKNLRKGKYTPFRIVQTMLAGLVLLAMLGSMASGMILSRYVFAFVNVSGGIASARNIHMACAYWGFVWMSLHLGFHWGMILGMVRKLRGKSSVAEKWTARALALAVAAYGIHAFVKRQIGSYMLMQIQFVFFDFEEPLAYFILDYMAAMGLFVFIGHYLCVGLN